MIPVLSLVTGTLNRPDSFARLVDSVIAHTDVPWELVVSDASDLPVDHDDPRVRILPERPRLGCVKGYNRAFRAALGEWVIWLNDDAEVVEGYALSAIAFMEGHPQTGLGCLYYSEKGGPFHINSAWSVPYANFGIIRRSLGDRVGWFDEDLTMYGNDNSLTLRVLLSGHGVAGIRDAKVIHHSVQDLTRMENQVHRLRDNDTLNRKYLTPSIKRQWQATYNRFRQEGDIVAWSHGRRPVPVR